jgi:hypothetical protein
VFSIIDLGGAASASSFSFERRQIQNSRKPKLILR